MKLTYDVPGHMLYADSMGLCKLLTHGVRVM